MEETLGFWAFSHTVVIPRLLDGMVITLKLAIISGTIGFTIGMIIALMRLSRVAIFRWFALAYITLFRGTPLLLQILFIYFAVPTLINVNLD